MSERIIPEMLIESKTPVDVEVWPSVSRSSRHIPETFNLVKPERSVINAAKEDFFTSGRLSNPDLRPTKISTKRLNIYEQRLLARKNQVKGASKTDSYVLQAYRWKINESLANIRMLEAGVEGDMRRFNAYNNFIYGAPDFDIFAATADWFRQSAANSLTKDEPVAHVAEKVMELVDDFGGDRSLLIPKPEVFERVKNRHYQDGGYFALLLSGVELPSEGKVPKDIGDRAIETALENIGSDLKILDAEGSAFSVERYAGGFKSPKDYNFILKRFIGLPLGHELTHELEYQNGLRQPVRLFSIGLDRYENGNEGRAVIREQLPYDSFEAFGKILRWQDIMRRHFAVSLAEGLASNGRRMNFSQVFEVINTIDRLWERSKKPNEPELADARADKRSWDLLADKVFCGTDGQNAAFLKNKCYLEGNVACWNNPEMIEAGDLGKFDITNPRHISFAQSVGVLRGAEW